MNMQFQPYVPHAMLKNHVEKIWVFSSSGPIPREDMKLIVPTGRIKLIIPFRNVATVTLNGTASRAKEHSMTLVGLTDVPVKVDSEADNPSGTVGVEFTPHGAYRFFRLNYNDVKNQTHPLTDVLGKTARQLEQWICNAPTNNDKVHLLQQFLIKQFSNSREDAIFDFCIEKIRTTKGKIPVKELERITGYSSRWLNMKFIERVGTSPKNLSAIVRFQQVYRAITTGLSAFDHRYFYDYYYDQSHFIKDFRRFTGMPPSKLEKMVNDFGSIYYRQ